ncbi:VanZ like family protein [Eubacterium ruminantium]|nr:VanZ like family protein [Eubacterium ruminantium]
MQNNKGKTKVLVIIIIVTLAFIWGNSLMTGEISSNISEWFRELLNKLFHFAKSSKEVGSGHVIRKIMHFTEFMILGLEITSLKKYKKKLTCTGIILSGILAAMIDETIQLFVPGRAGMLQDVWLDVSGYITGFVIMTFLRKARS